MWYISKEELHTVGNVRANRIDGSLHECPLSLPKGTIFELEDSPARTKFMKIYPQSEGLIRGISKNNLYSGRGDANVVIVEGNADELFKNAPDDFVDITNDMLTINEIENGLDAEPTDLQRYLMDRKEIYRQIYENEEERLYPEVLRKYSTLQEDQISYLAWAINNGKEEVYPEPLQMMMKDGFTYVRGNDDGYPLIFGFSNSDIGENGIVNFRKMHGYEVIDPDTLEHYTMTVDDLPLERRDRMCASFERDYKIIYENTPEANRIGTLPNRLNIETIIAEPKPAPIGEKKMAENTITAEPINDTDFKKAAKRAVEFTDKASLEDTLKKTYGDAFEGFDPDMSYVIDGVNGEVIGIPSKAIETGKLDPADKFECYLLDGSGMTNTTVEKSYISPEEAFGSFRETVFENIENINQNEIEESKRLSSEIQEMTEDTMKQEGYRIGAISDQKKFNDRVAEENDKSARNIEENMKSHPGMTKLEARKIELSDIHKRIDALHGELDQANVELVQAKNQLNLQVPGARQIVDSLDKRKDEIRSELASLRDSARDAKKQVMSAKIDIPVQAAIQKANTVKVAYEMTTEQFREGVRKMQFDGLLAYAQMAVKANKIPLHAARNTLLVDQKCLEDVSKKIKALENKFADPKRCKAELIIYRLKTKDFRSEITPEMLAKSSKKYQDLVELRDTINSDIFRDEHNLEFITKRYDYFEKEVKDRAISLGLANTKAVNKLLDEIHKTKNPDKSLSDTPLGERITQARVMAARATRKTAQIKESVKDFVRG